MRPHWGIHPIKIWKNDCLDALQLGTSTGATMTAGVAGWAPY